MTERNDDAVDSPEWTEFERMVDEQRREAEEARRNEEAIAEAVREVEAAILREREELQITLRAVEAAEAAMSGRDAAAADDGEAAMRSQRAAAIHQLEALVAMGFQVAHAQPLCDGVSRVEELVEQLMQTPT